MRWPTLRKVRNRGWTPIRYHTDDCVRTGWLIEEQPKAMLVHLVGDEGNKWIRGEERRYVRPLDTCRAEAAAAVAAMALARETKTNGAKQNGKS